MAEKSSHTWHQIRRALSLALVSSPLFAFSWAFGGMRGDVLRSLMPLVSLLCACGILFLPQCRPGERLREAYRRVWRAILRDPFFWVGMGLVLYLSVPLFNVGTSPLLDTNALVGGKATPPCPYLPFCMNRAEQTGIICWFGPTLLSALGVRQALVRPGKRLLFELLVWNAALLALLGFVQIVTGAHFPYWGEVSQKVHFFSVFAYPNMAGAFFTLMFACALGLWIFRIEDVEKADRFSSTGTAGFRYPRIHAHYPALPTALLFCAVLATYCRAAIVLMLILSAIFVAYVLLRPLVESGSGRARRLKTVVSVGAILLSFLGVVYVYAPPEISRELHTVNLFSVSDRVTGKGQYHTRIATAIMRDYPLFGVGGWGYRHFSTSYMMREKSEKSMQLAGGANVHNDYLQFLAEHGAVGFGLMALSLFLLMRPMFQTWRSLIKAENDRARSGMGASSLAVFSVEAPVLWVFLGTLAVLVHAFGDCPLRAASVLSLLYVLQAVSMGFLPHPKATD